MPDIDRIPENLLYLTKEDGSRKNLPKTGPYLGEVKKFGEIFINHLGSSVGVLIKSYTSKHFNSVMRKSEDSICDFQIDWLYVGQQAFVPIEIGCSEMSADRNTSITNKLTQCVKTIIPTFQLILYFWFLEFHKSQTGDFESFFGKHFKLVLFLPDVSIEQFKEFSKALDKKKSKNIKQLWKLLQEQKSALKFINIVLTETEGESNKSSLCYVKAADLLDANNEMRKEVDIQDLFTFNLGSEDSKDVFDYLSSIFCLSSLNFIDSKLHTDSQWALDVDERYLDSFRLWRAKNSTVAEEIDSQIKSDLETFILSPQQHAILQEKEGMSHVFLYGEPGTGKTYMLLAKCSLLLETKQVEKILLAIPESKTWFREWIQPIIDRSSLSGKISTCLIEDYLR